MRKLIPESLYVQLTFVVTVVLCAAIFSYSAIAAKKNETMHLDALRKNAVIMARNLAFGLAHHIIVADFAELDVQLLKAAELPNITQIVVTEPDGTILTNVRKKDTGPELATDLTVLPALANSRGFSFDGYQMHVVEPISNGHSIGWIRISYSTGQVDEMREMLLKNSLLMAFGWSFASFFILLLVLRKPLKGIQQLSQFARDLNVKKGMEIEIDTYCREVGDVARSLNYASRAIYATEQQLLAERERLTVTLHSIGDGVIATDTAGIVVLMNKVAEELTGWDAEVAVTKPLGAIFRVIDDQDGQQTENPVEKVLQSGQPVMMSNHTILVSRTGIERQIANSGAPIIDQYGKVLGVVLVFRDMTERYRLEGELARIQKLESLGVLAGGIAHDFNNILTAISGSISLILMHAPEDDVIADRLRMAAKATDRATQLSRQLLTFSRGGVPILKPGSITSLLRDTVSFSLHGSTMKAEFRLQNDLWNVEMDEGQISQVIQNLVLNAQQAMPHGGRITISASNFVKKDLGELPLAQGDYVRITVTDEGVGITPENLGKIFDPFFTTKQKGSGLGLAICHSIATKHNGYLGVESEPGKGTTFSLLLPAARGEVASVQPTGSVSPERAAVSKTTVLVMDDDAQIRALLVAMLEYRGHTVITTENGDEAVKEYRRRLEVGEKVGAVIVDLTVPGGRGGKEILSELRDLDRNVRAIVTSGYSNDPVIANFREYGFCAVLQKPFVVKDVEAALDKALAASRPVAVS